MKLLSVSVRYHAAFVGLFLHKYLDFFAIKKIMSIRSWSPLVMDRNRKAAWEFSSILPEL